MLDKLIDKLYKRTPSEWQELLHQESAVNKNRLDDEAAEQSQLFSNWAGLAATAHIHRKEMERNFDEVKASVELRVRKDPVGYGLEDKPKEAAIKAVVAETKQVKEAYDEFLQAYAYDKTMAVAEKTMEGRKTMLRLEGDLWLGEYYSTTNIREEQVNRFKEKISDTKRKARRRIKNA